MSCTFIASKDIAFTYQDTSWFAKTYWRLSLTWRRQLSTL